MTKKLSAGKQTAAAGILQFRSTLCTGVEEQESGDREEERRVELAKEIV